MRHRNPDPQSDPRSLADDPEFASQLDELDRGLSEGQGLDQAAPDLPHDTRDDLAVGRPVSGAVAIPSAPAVAEPVAAQTGAAAVAATQGVRRPLLDLFPPAPGAGNAPSRPVRVEPTRSASMEARSGDGGNRDASVVPPPGSATESVGSPAPRVDQPPSETRSDPAPANQTLTYESFYGFVEKPFSPSADPKFIYGSRTHERAVEDLLAAIRRREGIILLTGESGSGKTVVCRAVLGRVDRRTVTSFVSDPFATFEDFLTRLLVEFGVVSHDDVAADRLRRAGRAELTAALHDFLASLRSLQASAVVIVDEAQRLPAEVLEEIRVLADGDSTLQVVLVGQAELAERLAEPRLGQLAQRVTTRRRLEPLGDDEIVGYVTHRLAAAGPTARVAFSLDALDRVHELTGGVPRLVNRLCDGALELGYAASASTIDEGLLSQAAVGMGLIQPDAPRAQMVRTLIAVVGFVLLACLGAAAALVFRHRLDSLFGR